MREKYEAALGEISDAIEDYCANGNQRYYKRLNQAQGTIIQLIENYEALEVKHKKLLSLWGKDVTDWRNEASQLLHDAGYDENGKIIYDTWICPNCNKRYEVDYDDYKYCPNCGQAIDWGDEDD